MDLFCFFEDGGFRFPEKGCDIDSGGCFDFSPPAPELVPDRQQVVLAQHFAPDHLCDEVEFLDALDLYPGTLGYGYIDILADRTKSPLHLTGGTEDHPDIFCNCLDIFGSMHVR